MVLTNGGHSNGWASGFQIAFKIQNICNRTSFQPFEIQTSQDLRSPLYSYVNFEHDLENISKMQIASYLTILSN